MSIKTIRIHPAIGITRVGDHPSASFIGPERPGVTTPPEGGYKLDGMIKRQAARFRLFAYDEDDQLIQELTSDDAKISWRVHLANTKSAWHQFDSLNEGRPLRNRTNTPSSARARLTIDPGPRQLSAPRERATFDNGNFTAWDATGKSKTVSGIKLGDLETDEAGRLIVRGGHGKSGAPWEEALVNYANNPGWYDDTSDGPVNATVTIDGQTFEAIGSWVICGPPKFAPEIRDVVTVYDLLFQIAVDLGWLTEPQRPSLKFDIAPILNAAINIPWLQSDEDGEHHYHERMAKGIWDASDRQREMIFKKLRHPDGSGGNMPDLFDDWGQDRVLALTPVQYRMMEKWAAGDFVNDRDLPDPSPDDPVTPAGLDRAALENCVGGPLDPGIEFSWFVRDTYQYREPFRLDPQQPGLRPPRLLAGDVTKQMAVPWQADFFDCGDYWWPTSRPNQVLTKPRGKPVSWTRELVTDYGSMVDNWAKLGFILKNNQAYLESKRG